MADKPKRKTAAKTARTRTPIVLRSDVVETRPAGPGRPPSQIRARARGSFDDRLAQLDRIASGEIEVTLMGVCPRCGWESMEPQALPIRTAVSDVIRSIDTLGKYGLGPATQTAIPVADVRQLVTSVYDVIFDKLPAAQAKKLAAAIAVEVSRLDAPE